MRMMCAVAVALGCAGAPLAGQATGIYEDPEGPGRIAITIEDPEGEIGIEHFEAIRVGRAGATATGKRRTAGAAGPWLRLSADSVRELPARGVARVRGSRPADAGGEFVVDWSGVTARIETLQPIGCTLSEAVFTGAVSIGQSVFVIVQDAMSTASVLSNLNKRGDADLYVYDGIGKEVCRSENSKKSRIADTCAFLDTTCSDLAESSVEVYGFKPFNRFHLKIWFTDAF